MSLRMQAVRPGIAVWMVLVVVVVVVVAIGTGYGVATAVHPECPHTTEHGEVSVAGPITNIPEFHDCQRLIIDGEYGPVLAVWVSNRIDSLFNDVEIQPLDSLPNETVSGSTPVVAPADTSARVSEPVLQFYNYGERIQFPGIGVIPPGFSCVYFWHVNGEFKAWMASGERATECRNPQPIPPRTEGIVVTRVVTGRAHSDYPPVARLEIDTTRTHAVGVKCGRGWCRMGTGEPVIDHSGLAKTPGEQHVFAVPGWYDEQVLAAPDGFRFPPFRFVKGGGLFGYRLVWSPRKLAPSGVRGTFFPDAALKQQDGNAFKGWVRVGEVHLSAPSEHYAETLNFEFSTSGPAATIFLRHLDSQDPVEPDDPDEIVEDHDWAAMIVSSANDTIYRKVIWRGYHASKDQPGWVPVPGTVRWRWVEDDERTWEWCPEGCCETTGEKTDLAAMS